MHKTYFANIWVTHRCNYRCRYCYVKPQLSTADLSLEKADTILNFVARTIDARQDLIINFHGGEPTLNFAVVKHIVDRAQIIMPNKMSFGMTTNGSTLTEEVIDYLAEKFKFNLSLSIDGDENTKQ